MFKFYFILSNLIVLSLTKASAGDCFMCEEIREKNKNLPPLKHEYYEDYLEELRLQGKSTVEDIEFDEEGTAKKTEE